jgi:hypothetical protein
MRAFHVPLDRGEPFWYYAVRVVFQRAAPFFKILA